MKKTLLILAMMFAFMKPVHAQMFTPFAAGATFAGASATQMAATVGSGAAFALFIYLNTTGEKPFEEMFTNVDYKYPGDKKMFFAPSNIHADHTPYHVMTPWGDSIRSDG